MLLIGIGWGVVIGVAVVRIYRDQRATDEHLCAVVQVLHHQAAEARAKLALPPPPPLPACPPVP